MMKIVSAASILAIAAGAQAAPFQMLSFAAGGGVPGIAGPGFSVAAGQGFFNSGSAGVQTTNANTFTAGAFDEFSSYFVIDAFGPSARGQTGANQSVATRAYYGNYAPGSPSPATNYTAGVGGTIVEGPGSHIGDPSFGDPVSENQARAGIGRAPQPYFSGFAPNIGGGRSTDDGMFIGRLTIWANGTLSGGARIDLQEGGNQVSGVLMLGGGAVAIGSQLYVLEAHTIATPNITAGSFVDGNQDDLGFVFGQAKVLDLWVRVIPTPGALALLGIGGLTTIRRRRA